ncbi:MAG: condensation protein, partial [Acaryochloris sp. CRU_2_0]|nr:condensation protein [Acaryochloris sp. CRU_2_0]
MNIENIQEIYALSPLQEGFLPETDFSQTEHCHQACYGVQGDLNIEHLQQTWQLVVDHYPLLRTCFVWKRVEQPLQIVQKHLKVTLETYDYRQLSETEQKTSIQQRLQNSLETGLDPAKAPLVRLNLCQTGAISYQLLC